MLSPRKALFSALMATSLARAAPPTKDEVLKCISSGQASLNKMLPNLRYLHRDQWGGSCYAHAAATVFENQIEPPIRKESEKFSPECSALLFKIYRSHALLNPEGMSEFVSVLSSAKATLIDNDNDTDFMNWMRNQQSLPSESDCQPGAIESLQHTLVEIRNRKKPITEFADMASAIQAFTRALKHSSSTDQEKIRSIRAFSPSTKNFNPSDPGASKCPDTENLLLAFACMRLPVSVTYMSTTGIPLVTERPGNDGTFRTGVSLHNAVLVGIENTSVIDGKKPEDQIFLQDTSFLAPGDSYDYSSGRTMSLFAKGESCRIQRLSVVMNEASKNLYDQMDMDGTYKRSLWSKNDFEPAVRTGFKPRSHK